MVMEPATRRLTSRKRFLASVLGAGAGAAALGAAFPLPRTARGAEPDAPPAATPTPAPGGGGTAVAPGLTRALAEFVVNGSYAALPGEVIELGKKSLLDGLGLALAGGRAKSGALVESYLSSLGFAATGGGGSTVIGTALRLPVRFAAFANGVAIHADDFDDTQLSLAPDRVYGLLTHPTVPVLPGVLAQAEADDRSGRDLLLAYHLGVEVECKVAEAIHPRHYQQGFHSTGTCGPFGAAAALAKLRGLDVGGTCRALGIAGAESSGLRENFGTMTKPFQAGHAAESGVVAADLAALGWTAAEDILEAARGFFQAAGGGFDPGSIVGKLGQPWTFQTPGVSIKPYPSGSLTHPGMTEMARLIREHGLTAGGVARVEVGTNRNMPTALIHHQPRTDLQAKFSMEFCMAALLTTGGKAGLTEFSDEFVNRPDVQDLLRRVRFYVNPEAEAAGYDKMTTIIDVFLRDGRKVSGRADFGKGSPQNPMSYAEVADKFRGCADFARWPRERAERIIERVARFETLASVRELTTLLGKNP